MEQKIKNEYSLGRRIKELRLSNDNGVTELATHLNILGCESVTRQCLVKIESGKRNVRLSELRAIKTALNVTYEQILDE